MARIHHATAKRAEAAKIALFLEDETAVAVWEETRVEAEDAKIALDAMLLLQKVKTEYPAAEIELAIEGDAVTFSMGEENVEIENVHDLDAAYAEIGDALGAALEASVENEETKRTGSVVREGYKEEYAARGDADNCGDWFAKTVIQIAGKGWTPAYVALLEANAVPYEKYVKATLGWQGRARMTTGNMLRSRIAASGVLTLSNGDTIVVPEEFVERHKPKGKKAAA